ncbi:hypothetical protein [Flavobacteriaceae bacterium 14752]|uniref:hypothetical protein n=1 Tax=Mesohalobacter salilacus TaxID=2491711 RepID=UPI000F641C59|nr:hypothetical protein EIG84_04570 [Flavobacteriaceae bacterium 14752]
MNFKHLQQKTNKLNHIKTILKQEFFGIDNAINQIIESIQPWYLFNETQTHPLIINLWGLTGTGKTALVKRLVKLLDKEQAFFRFEMNSEKRKDIDRQLSEAIDVYENEDYIFCFDEFQHLRTLYDDGTEKDVDMEFNLWDFLDVGEFDMQLRIRDVNGYLKWYKTLQIWIENGFKLKNGFIYYDEQPKKLEQYLRNFYKDFKSKSYEYVERVERHNIFKLFQDQFENILDFESYFFQLDETQLLGILYEASKRKRKTAKGNMRKSLLFIIGNLDEAYEMSSDFNPDLNADAFHKQSLEIKIPEIKEALKKRFRNEQIARLGNNHIIYPALNKSAYHNIIERHLQNLKNDFASNYKVKLKFASSVNQMIYNNGVYPTQGVRPLKSSLKTFIDANLGQILSYLVLKKFNADEIKISYHTNTLHIIYMNQEKSVEELDLTIDASLDNIRQSTDKNKQSVTAIHESGHALLSIVLSNEIPTQLNSTTANTRSDGFTHLNFEDKLIVKKDLINLAARALGGIEAERLIFGEDLITLGSSSDLKKVTNLIIKSLYENAMGSKLGFYHIESLQNRYGLYEPILDLQKEAEVIILKAQKLAKDLLSREKTLLLNMTQKLIEHSTLEFSDIKTLIEKHAITTSLVSIETNSNQQPHLEKLKYQIDEIADNDVKKELDLLV